MQETLKQKSWFVVNALQLVQVVELKLVLNMEQITLNLNVSSVVQQLNGSVGEQLISAKAAIQDRTEEIMCQGKNVASYLNVLVQQSALLKFSILLMEKSTPQAV